MIMKMLAKSYLISLNIIIIHFNEHFMQCVSVKMNLSLLMTGTSRELVSPNRCLFCHFNHYRQVNKLYTV